MTWALFLVGVGAAIGLGALLLELRGARRPGGPVNARIAALRCSICDVDWPNDMERYGVCPACLEPTGVVAGYRVCPLDAHEARSIMLHHEFTRFYAARERDRAA